MEIAFFTIGLLILMLTITPIMSPKKAPIAPPQKIDAPPTKPVLSVMVNEVMNAPRSKPIIIKKILKNVF